MITIKGIQDEDFVNYKKPSMFICFPKCSWKCEKECGKKVCQNGTLATSPDIHIDVEVICERYLKNLITSAIVLGGLEVFDTFKDLIELISCFRKYTDDEIIIYTGYNKDEITDKVVILSQYKNLIIKFGRYIPNQSPHYDEVLGVYLASDNQYAEKIS